jgi:hypothetical protein
MLGKDVTKMGKDVTKMGKDVTKMGDSDCGKLPEMWMTPQELRSVTYPKCARNGCSVWNNTPVHICVEICPYKFDHEDNPREKWASRHEEAIWGANVNEVY